MKVQKLSLEELLDLIDREAYRGIINKDKIMKFALNQGIPKLISDTRGELRLAVERIGNLFEVIQYPTELATETIGEIYPNGSGELEIEVDFEMDDSANNFDGFGELETGVNFEMDDSANNFDQLQM